MSRPAEEADFRLPEFRGAKVEDYEVRKDGRVVRKDRFEVSMREVARLMGADDNGYECDLALYSLRAFIESAEAKGVSPYHYEELPK